MSRRLAPYHTTNAPEAVCRVTKASLPQCCTVIARRVRSVSHSRGVGVMLFIDPEGNAYCLGEDSGISERWFRERFRDYVGLYRIVRTTFSLDIASEGLAEDIADHLGFT